MYEGEVRAFGEKVKALADERGIAFAVKYVKNSRTAVTRVISGSPLESIDLVALKDGWPIWLLSFRPLIKTTDGKRFLMTLLTSLRGITLKPVLDLSPIIEEWKGSLPALSRKEIRHIFRQLGIKPIRVEWKEFHMSTKKGPLGQALLCALTELTLLPTQLQNDIISVGGGKLGNVIAQLQLPRLGGISLVGIWTFLFPAKSLSFRKISYFADKEGKTRVIAILDYWSQTALRPLHDEINFILKRINNDCTFNQNQFLKCLPSKGPYHSIDLSNATDRMPIALQLLIVTHLIGRERAEAWARILVGYEYTVSQGGPSGIKYNCGQPMGAYSSWCVMALTHHFIVRLAALRAGFPHFSDYALLGDDLVIANTAVATEYRKLLTTLDMPVSEQKTHASNDVYEFAKRWIHAGEEFTGFAVSGLLAVWKRYSLLHNFLQTQLHHGWSLSDEAAPDLIGRLYTFFGRPAQAERVIKLYSVFNQLAKAKQTGDYSPLLSVVEIIFGLSLLSEPPLSGQALSDFAKAIVTEAKKRLVERDLEKFQKDAFVVNDRLNKDFHKAKEALLGTVPGLSDQDYRALLREFVPMVRVLNNLIDGSMQALILALDPEDSPEKADFYLNSGLNKYFVSKGVFSMRSSHSINLAQSMVTKSILDVIREKSQISPSVGSATSSVKG